MSPQKRALKLHKKILQASIEYYKNRGYDTAKFDAEMSRVNNLLKKTK